MPVNLDKPPIIIKAASACIWRGDDVLLVQRGKALGHGRWSLPGGRIEGSETEVAAAARELLEETAVVADLRHFVGNFNAYSDQATFVISCFTGNYQHGQASAGDDAMAVAWVDHRKLSDYDLVPNIETAVRLARKLMAI
jgi:8-oxo-dGTP diphosphatase